MSNEIENHVFDNHSEAGRCLLCKKPRCSAACPVHTPVPEAMALYRRYINRVTIAGGAGALSTAILFVLMVRWRRKDLHRTCTYAAAVPLLMLLVAQFAAKAVPSLRVLTYGRVIPVTFPEGDFLVYIAEESFGRQLAVFEIIGALILYFLLIYVTLKVAGKDRLFRGGSSLYEGPDD